MGIFEDNDVDKYATLIIQKNKKFQEMHRIEQK